MSTTDLINELLYRGSHTWNEVHALLLACRADIEDLSAQNEYWQRKVETMRAKLQQHEDRHAVMMYGSLRLREVLKDTEAELRDAGKTAAAEAVREALE